MKPCGIPHDREPTGQMSNCPISSSEISLRGKNGTTQVQSHQPQPRPTGESAQRSLVALKLPFSDKSVYITY